MYACLTSPVTPNPCLPNVVVAFSIGAGWQVGVKVAEGRVEGGGIRQERMLASNDVVDAELNSIIISKIS